MSLRLLTIMGSGETAPTMARVHRAVVERLGPGPRPGLLLDTPFGFQTNASEIAARAVGYFRDSVGADLEVAGLRSSADLRAPGADVILAKLAAASLVFAGPGSPTYALRQWRDTLVPSLLAEKLALGGAVTFASAAALTLGSHTVPVYEIYKVGEDPRWVDGLDLLSVLGLPAVVIPHYDNAEGGTHDTRFCYLGEVRLSAMEHELPDDTFVLGVDEHTALSIDFDAGSAAVTGHGVVTVRTRGRSATISSGETVPLGRLVELASQLRGEPPPRSPSTTSAPDRAASAVPGGARGSPLLQAIREDEEAFRWARSADDAPAMVSAALALEEEMWAWRADTLQSDAMDRGRSALRAMVTELGRVALSGTRDPVEVVGPYVELALSLRESARRERRFADADEVRERLVALGVEVHDSASGSVWELRDRPLA